MLKLIASRISPNIVLLSLHEPGPNGKSYREYHGISYLRDPAQRAEVAQAMVEQVRPGATLTVVSQVSEMIKDAIERYK